MYTCLDPRTGAEHACSVRHEAFLAPEVFFRPDLISDEYTTPLPQVPQNAPQSLYSFFSEAEGCICLERLAEHVILHLQLVDRVIQSCPIDTRRALYGNIVLSVRPTLPTRYTLIS